MRRLLLAAIIVATLAGPAWAPLIDDAPAPIPCAKQMLPSSKECPKEFEALMRKLEKFPRRSRIEELEDRVDQLETMIRELQP